jgi:acetyl-CoA C-acetyltransferase
MLTGLFLGLERSIAMQEAWIIDACRTPRGIGKIGKGALAEMHPQHVGAAVLRALAERTGIDTSEVEDVIWGNGQQSGRQGNDLGRMTALDAGYGTRASGITIHRFCGSSLSAVGLAAAKIMAGMEDLNIAGGAELMSYRQLLPRDPSVPPLPDAGNERLRASHPQTSQGLCADAIATLEGIEREELDELAFESQQRAARAIAEGRFDRSLISVYKADGTLALDREEYPRPQTTREGLAELAPSFAKTAQAVFDESGTTFGDLIQQVYPDLRINHVHHAGNSSGVVDGAAALLLASPEYARSHGLKPRARVVTHAEFGDSPTLMLNAPVPATLKALAKAGLTPADIDLWEVNEAFAVVPEKFMRDLGLDRSKVNVNGGSIALGHPIGATGAMLVGTLLDELERQDLKRGLVTMCAAGGMAPALIIERI